MSGGIFVCCPNCDRLTLGAQDNSGHVYPQPHDCPGGNR